MTYMYRIDIIIITSAQCLAKTLSKGNQPNWQIYWYIQLNVKVWLIQVAQLWQRDRATHAPVQYGDSKGVGHFEAKF